MSKPDTVERILCRASGIAGVGEQRTNRFAQRFSNGIEPRLIRDDVQVGLRHDDLLLGGLDVATSTPRELLLGSTRSRVVLRPAELWRTAGRPPDGPEPGTC
jgi:hypothetical protein